jgi:DNA-binding SARP family transcriptional activator
MELRLIGGFELSIKSDVEEPVTTSPARFKETAPAGAERSVSFVPAVQRLLAFVALSSRPLRRTYVAGSLWSEKTDERAAANLRSMLWRLRASGLELIDATATHVSLTAELCVDVREAERDALAVLRGETTELTPEHETWLRRDLLPDWYDDWLLIEQERYRQLRLHALEVLSRAYTRAGHYGRAVDAALAAVAAEPLRESAHRCLIEAHLAEGNNSEAQRHHDLFHRRLRDGLAESSVDEPRVNVAVTAP